MQDPYTSYYDAKVVRDFVMLTQELGFTPILLPFKPNGKAMHIKGFLKRFSKTAQNQAEFLNRMAKLGIPLVGVDPAIVLSYRDEYKEALQEKRGDFHVLTAHEWLKQRLQNADLQEKLKTSPKLTALSIGIYSRIVRNLLLCRIVQKNGKKFLEDLDNNLM